jgi:hypothetical protein
MSLANWIKQYESELVEEYLSRNTNPEVIKYLENNPKMIHWQYLSENPVAIEILKKNTHRIDWKNICLNPHPEAMEMIKEHYSHYLKRWKERGIRTPPHMVLSWENLSKNPNAVEFLKENPQNVCGYFQEYDNDWAEGPVCLTDEELEEREIISQIEYGYLSENPSAIEYLKENPHIIVNDYLCTNPNGIKLLQENPTLINWYWFSENPCAVHILIKNIENIHWCQLSKNKNAIYLLEQHLEKVDWTYFSANENAVYLLEMYPEKIDWRWLCKNPNADQIFKKYLDPKNGKYANLNIFNKLDWKWLSENPCIFAKTDDEKIENNYWI